MKTQRLWILKLLIVLQIGLMAFLFFRATSGNQYFLANEDEVINYCAAKVFSATGSVRAGDCIAEDLSRIGQMNWYGPGYHIIYGTLQRLFGDHTTLFIQLNAAFLLMAVILVLLLPVPTEDKLLSCISLLFAEQFTFYVFTYFPETLHVLFSVLLTFLLVKIYKSTNDRDWIRYAILFVVIVLILVTTRITAVFWLAALIGLSRTRKRGIQMAIVFIFGLGLTLFYMRFFTAPPYGGDLQKINQLYSFNLVDFVVKTIRATARNTIQLLTSGSVGVYLLLFLMLLAVIQWWKTKDRLLLATVLFCLLFMIALMAYYSGYHWYFLKQSVVMVPLLIISLIITTHSARLKYGIAAVTLVTLPFTYQKISTSISERKYAFSMLEDSREFQTSINLIPEFISEQTEVTVLWRYKEFDFGGTTEALLPFLTRAGKPILYTTNIVDDNAPVEDKFRLHHKIKVNYVLSRQPVDLPYVQQVHATDFYYFYKVVED